MKTLIDIQPDLMEALLRETQCKTKKEAITTAITTYLKLKKRGRLASLISNYDFGYTLEELERARADGQSSPEDRSKN